jgi:ABC-type bacteriocin/lantibiotic exporter with double-glycine peptidase domain
MFSDHIIEGENPKSLKMVVNFTHFYFRYGRNPDEPFTLNDITFDVKRGEILFIGGNSGSGKSTLCNAISGQIPFKIKIIEINDHF